jgi:hypothetical protein
MLTPTEWEALRQSQRDAFVKMKAAFKNARIQEMQTQKPKREAEQKPFTMDDIARKFLTTPPTPHKPAPKKKPRKAK